MTSMDSVPKDGTVAEVAPDSLQKDDKPSSETVTLSKEQWETINNRLTRIESGAQSEKDRAVRKVSDKVEKLENDLRPVLERASREGKSVDDVLKELDASDEDEFRDNVRKLAKALSSGALLQPGSDTTIGNNGEVARIMQEYELSTNDPAVASLY